MYQNVVPYQYQMKYQYQQSPSQNYQQAQLQQAGQAKKHIDDYSYLLQDQIGKGFSSKVYKGQHVQSRDQVAIKVIDKSALKTPFHHQLLKSEVEALSQLDSNFIMKLYKVVETQNNTYLITEYCEGGDLAGKITKLGAQKEQFVQMVIQGVVKGYSAMKAKGVVHRDIKPANILLSKSNIPKISDFGFAMTQNSAKTMPNINVGSPLYMSPQALKMSRYSDKSDIWAIGVTAYELLFGQVPWSANSEIELANKMSSQMVNFPAKIGVSHQCQDFIRRCLTVDEQLRFTVEEMQMHCWVLQSDPQKPVALGERKNVDWVNRVMVGNTKKYEFQSSVQDKENQWNDVVQKETRNFSLMNPMTDERLAAVENELFKKNDYIVLSQINFCRFLMKIYQLLENVNEFRSALLREKMQFFVIKNIMLKVNKLKDLVGLPSINTLELKNFQKYSQTSSYSKLSTVINEYYTKYTACFGALWIMLQPSEIKANLQSDKKFDAVFDQNLTEFESFYIILQSSLRVAVRELEHYLTQGINMQQDELSKPAEKNVVLLDYLVTYFQLTALMLDEFNHHEKFAEKSKIEEIAEGKPVRLGLGHYFEIQNKIHQLEI